MTKNPLGRRLRPGVICGFAGSLTTVFVKPHREELREDARVGHKSDRWRLARLVSRRLRTRVGGHQARNRDARADSDVAGRRRRQCARRRRCARRRQCARHVDVLIGRLLRERRGDRCVILRRSGAVLRRSGAARAAPPTPPPSPPAGHCRRCRRCHPLIARRRHCPRRTRQRVACCR